MPLSLLCAAMPLDTAFNLMIGLLLTLDLKLAGMLLPLRLKLVLLPNKYLPLILDKSRDQPLLLALLLLSLKLVLLLGQLRQ